MKTLRETREIIKQRLQGDSRFGGVDIRHGHTGGRPPIAPKTPVLIIGLEKVEATPGGFGGYLGREESVAHHGLHAQIQLSFTGYFPEWEDSLPWDTLFEGLCEVLLGGDLGVEAVWAENIVAEPQLHSTRTRAYATLQTLLSLSEDTSRIRQVVVSYEEGGTP